MSAEADKIIDLYRRHAEIWTERRGELVIEQKWLDRFIALLPKEASVLDLGCGSGAPIGRHLLQRGFTVTGVDAAPELIEIAKSRESSGHWIASDMRGLDLQARFNGILAWHSLFHFRADDQRAMFAIFAQHATKGTALMFTSGPKACEAIGNFEGEPLYHASLDTQEYQALLNEYRFDVIEYVPEDPDCGGATVWLAQYIGGDQGRR